jgi:hypothetical protein
MNTVKRVIATAEVVLILPAALFMAALAVREWRPLQHEPTHTARLIVAWYTSRSWTFPALLVRLPAAVLVTGCATLLWVWSADRASRKTTPRADDSLQVDASTLIIAATTLTAGYILAVIAMRLFVN